MAGAKRPRSSRPEKPVRRLSTLERAFAAAIVAGLALGLTALGVDRLGPRAHRTAAADEAAPPEGAERQVESTSADEAWGYVGVKTAHGFHDLGKLDDVLKDGPAYRAGLRKGDLVERIEGNEIKPRGGSPAPSEDEREPATAEEEIHSWLHFEGERWSDLTFRVRGKGDLRVRRELKRSELLEALRRRERTELTAYIARVAAKQARQRGELAGLQRKAGELPSWFEEQWKKHAAAARDPLDEVLAGPSAPDGLRAVREAIDRQAHGELVAGMARAGDVVALCVSNPRTMGLPPHLHDLQTLSGTAEARRLLEAGKFEAARRIAEAAAEGDGFSYSTDDDRYRVAAEAALREATKLEGLGEAAARTSETLAHARERYERDFKSPPPEIP